MKYERRIVSVVIAPVGEPLFSEMATCVSIADEAAGEFIEVEQRGGKDLGKICIDLEEWPALRSAIDDIVAQCRLEGGK